MRAARENASMGNSTVGNPVGPTTIERSARAGHPRLRNFYGRLLARADILIDGPRPWDITIHDPRLFARCLRQGTLGLGDAYVDGWWESPALDQFFAHVIAAHLDEQAINIPRRVAALWSRLLNLQDLTRARRVAEVHYDLNNELYAAMLGRRMVYTCGYWRHAEDLDTAQEHKLDLVCRKLQLEPGMRVLDIGCGWGSFARFAAERYGAHVVGVTISHEQADLARQLCADLPVEIRLQDYRAVTECFDRVVSLGMFEHVGHKNYRLYMETVRRNVNADGLFLLHTIGRNDHGSGIDPWVTKYIFPNSEIPGLPAVARAVDRVFVIEDMHNFGADYARTLLAWYENFHEAWPRFESRLPAGFYRLWKYYLLMFAGIFRARGLQVWQFVLAPRGVADGYQRPWF